MSEDIKQEFVTLSTEVAYTKNLGNYESQTIKVYVQAHVPDDAEPGVVTRVLKDLIDEAKLAVYREQGLTVNVSDEGVITPEVDAAVQAQAAQSLAGSQNQHVSGSIEFLGKFANNLTPEQRETALEFFAPKGTRKVWVNESKFGGWWLKDADNKDNNLTVK